MNPKFICNIIALVALVCTMSILFDGKGLLASIPLIAFILLWNPGKVD